MPLVAVELSALTRVPLVARHVGRVAVALQGGSTILLCPLLLATPVPLVAAELAALDLLGPLLLLLHEWP